MNLSISNDAADGLIDTDIDPGNLMNYDEDAAG